MASATTQQAAVVRPMTPTASGRLTAMALSDTPTAKASIAVATAWKSSVAMVRREALPSFPETTATWQASLELGSMSAAAPSRTMLPPMTPRMTRVTTPE